MSKIISIIKNTMLAAGVVMMTQGCEVDVMPTSRYSEESIWSNPANIPLYLAENYGEFNRFKFGQFPIGYDNATDALTDIMKYTSAVSGNGTVNILASDASRVNAAGPQLDYWG